MTTHSLSDQSIPADWRRVQIVYRQCLDAVADPQPYLPPQVTAFLAEIIARQSANYYGCQDKLVNDALEAFKRADGAISDPNGLYFDERFARLPEYTLSKTSGRRRPTPFEAVVETCRRLRDLQSIEAALAPETVGAILGGSASYGRFFNVVGGNPTGPSGSKPRKASDLDVLLVVESFDDLGAALQKLTPLQGSSVSDIERFQLRLDKLLEVRAGLDYPACVFSGKVRLWDTMDDPLLADLEVEAPYFVSFHVIELEDFDRLTLRAYSRIDSNRIPPKQTIVDIRESEADRDDHQRNFAARNRRLEITHDLNVVPESVVRHSHSYVIGESDDDYYPGMFQNLILPQFDVRWGNNDFRRRVDSFRWKMVERLRYEQSNRHEYLRLSMSHTRSQVFAPHAVRSVDASTIMP